MHCAQYKKKKKKPHSLQIKNQSDKQFSPKKTFSVASDLKRAKRMHPIDLGLTRETITLLAVLERFVAGWLF